jgi:hypothetical protein
MARWSGNKVALCLAGAIALAGCLGGQTSDPGNSVGCTPQKVPAGEAVSGVSPAQLARTFAGSYTSTLRWLGGSAAGALVPDEPVTITVTYQGADGTSCPDVYLSVPVAIEITTRDSGIHETGNATLFAGLGSVDRAGFSFNGNQVSVNGDLIRSNGTIAISGTLGSRTADLPGSSARFPAVATSTDAGSGGSGGAP